MSGTIGGVSCDTVKGNVRAKKERVAVWTRPGYDGYGAQQLGLGDSGAQFVASKWDSIGNVESWVQSIEALQGTKITVVNDWAQTYNNVLVTRVSMPSEITSLAHGAVGHLIVEGIII